MISDNKNMKKSLILLTTFFLISCSHELHLITTYNLELVPVDEFIENLDPKTIESAVEIKDQTYMTLPDLIVTTTDGRKYRVNIGTGGSFQGLFGGERRDAYFYIKSRLKLTRGYTKQPRLIPGIDNEYLPLLRGIIMFIWLFLPVLAANLASSRNQSKILWFFLTLILPPAIVFIAAKDRIKKRD